MKIINTRATFRASVTVVVTPDEPLIITERSHRGDRQIAVPSFAVTLDPTDPDPTDTFSIGPRGAVYVKADGTPGKARAAVVSLSWTRDLNDVHRRAVANAYAEALASVEPFVSTLEVTP